MQSTATDEKPARRGIYAVEITTFDEDDGYRAAASYERCDELPLALSLAVEAGWRTQAIRVFAEAIKEASENISLSSADENLIAAVDAYLVAKAIEVLSGEAWKR